MADTGEGDKTTRRDFLRKIGSNTAAFALGLTSNESQIQTSGREIRPEEKTVVAAIYDAVGNSSVPFSDITPKEGEFFDPITHAWITVSFPVSLCNVVVAPLDLDRLDESGKTWVRKVTDQAVKSAYNSLSGTDIPSNLRHKVIAVNNNTESGSLDLALLVIPDATLHTKETAFILPGYKIASAWGEAIASASAAPDTPFSDTKVQNGFDNIIINYASWVVLAPRPNVPSQETPESDNLA